jgi:hypothetical protein
MKTLYSSIILWCLTLAFCSSCQTIDEEPALNKQIVKVKARSSGNSQINYPLYLYAFDEEGSCSASQTINQPNDSIKLTLPAGNYRVVAISDISGGYQLPENPNALDDISIISNNGALTPMMMGKADITIGENDTSLNITMSYMVTAISVALKGIPTDVTNVTLSLSPMYKAISMYGEYTENSHRLEIPCKLNTSNIWYANSIYTFPGGGKETIFSILLTYKDGTECTYAYTYQGFPEANHPFNIGGNYIGGITVGGNLAVNGWGTPSDIEFNFGSTNNNKEDNENSSDIEISNLPQAGDLVNDCIAVKVIESNENKVTLLILDTVEWICYASDAYRVPEEAGDNWRLPNEAEAKLLNSMFRDETLDILNERLSNNGFSPILVDQRYLYDKDGEAYAFGFKSTSKFQKAGTSTKYRVRLVKSYEYTIK